MDQNKNQGTQRPGTQSGQQHTQGNQPTTPNPNREPAEGPRQAPGQGQQGAHEQTRGTQGNQSGQGNQGERGRGTQGERNKGDVGRDRGLGEEISNRGMDRELDEQSELPERGSRQSDR